MRSRNRPRRTISNLGEVHERCLIFVRDMLNARIKGTLTPEVQQNSETLAKKLNEWHKWNLSGGEGLRELTSYGRSIDLPIGGNGRGYFYATSSNEMQVVDADLSRRIAKMELARAGVRRCIKKMQQVEAELAQERITLTPSEIQQRMERYLGERIDELTNTQTNGGSDDKGLQSTGDGGPERQDKDRDEGQDVGGEGVPEGA